MPRVMRCANHCSPVELCLLKSLRLLACADSEQQAARRMLTKIGLEHYQVFFQRLVGWVLQERSKFGFHMPESAFISADELNLLASLAQVSRKSTRDALCNTVVSSSMLQKSIEDCGKILLETNVVLKFRPVPEEVTSV